MGRSRKDSQSNTLPVENYRKQIGRQDYKKNDPQLRATKRTAESKENAPTQYKDAALMLVTLVVAVFVVYLLFYFLLNENMKA